MDDATLIFECGECSTTGFLFVKDADEEILEMIHCPSCGTELSNYNFELNKLVNDEVIESIDESINDFIDLKK